MSKVTEKQMKAAIKEGAKKGQDIQGMNAMGGGKYFHLSVDAPEGNWELLEAVMESANQPVDEAAEERKGGAGDFAKIILSASTEELIALCHVPQAIEDEGILGAKEWLTACMAPIKGEVIGEVENCMIKGVAKADKDNNLFPLKMRDTAIGMGFELLRKKKLAADDDSSEEDLGAMHEAAGIEW